MQEGKTKTDILTDLKVNPEIGLTEEEAKRRLTVYGKNELAKENVKTPFAMFLEQLNDPLIFVLFLAAAISMLLREFSDTVIILVVILVNSVVGVLQEGKAQKALDALKQMTSPVAVVKREEKVYEIPASQLVPGDIVLLEAGRQIPADLRLITTVNLRMEEAALTGESVPVEKNADFVPQKTISLGDSVHMAFMSTNVIYGRGEGVVISTGMQTEIGKIAHSINHAQVEATPLQKRLADLGKLLSIVAIVLCAALFGIAILQHRNIPEMLITAISLAVAAVPEGLPAVVTIVLALSVSRMVNIHAIIRRLPSVETLGAVSVVCSDKTGTLTQNQMTVTLFFTDQQLFPVSALSYEKYPSLVEGFLLCNDSSISEEGALGDPTELALLTMVSPKLKEQLDAQMPRTSEIPFDSKRKLMTTVHRKKSASISYTKGSVEEILKRSTHILIHGKVLPITSAHKKEILEAVHTMSSEALRTLALATRLPEKSAKSSSQHLEENLVFIGIVGMIDPAREGVADSIVTFKDASVKTVMITGDHVDTAFTIAKNLGIADDRSQCISGEELEHISDEELQKKAVYTTVFARVSPEHKVRIVKAFKGLGNIVAMTGDGVNDAPSLKTADIGIAMGKNGTDVAKNASDLILTDDNFTTIEKAIEEGRGIYENIKKSILFLLSSNFGEIITMFFSILFWLPSPLKASHILWINLITDSAPALALGVDKNNAKLLMKKPPRDPKEHLFAHGGLFCTLFYGTLIAAISLIAYLTIPYGVLVGNHLPFTIENITRIFSNPDILTRSQTYAFTVLGLSQLFHAIGMRNTSVSIFRMNHLSNPLMIFSFFLGIFLQLIVTEVPYLIQIFGTAKLSLEEWGALLLLACIPLLAHELLIQLSFLKRLPKFTKPKYYQENSTNPRKI